VLYKHIPMLHLTRAGVSYIRVHLGSLQAHGAKGTRVTDVRSNDDDLQQS
jgi:hypothetical protein